MKKFSGLLILGILFLSAGCASKRTPQIFTPNGNLAAYWTPEELEQNIAAKKDRETSAASYHFIRVRGAEKPHTHQEHDLTVILLSGKAKVHFRNREYFMEPGDIVEIPKGTYHWAENLFGAGSEVYAVFTPPYDGKDFHEEK